MEDEAATKKPEPKIMRAKYGRRGDTKPVGKG